MRQKWFRGEADGGCEGKEEIDLCGPKRDWYLYWIWVGALLKWNSKEFAACGVCGSQHETKDQWPWTFSLDNLVKGFCCNERTICSVNKRSRNSESVMFESAPAGLPKVFPLQYSVNISTPYGGDCAYDLWPTKIGRLQRDKRIDKNQEYIPQSKSTISSVFFSRVVMDTKWDWIWRAALRE